MVVVMSTESRTAKDIFVELVSNASPAEWDEQLKQACHGDDELQNRVRSLLRAHAEPGSFLEQPAVAVDATVLHEPSISEQAGTVIGPYKLLQQIGEGGMGVVFMAEQAEPIRRTVALKIVKPGMDTRQVIARFEAERQALAMMDHPNIAKVLDAGTTDSGRPYFVMELVKGVPITKYCDEKHLSLRERLELMLPVCQAVQHAHQKGIIHRDIKPSNVLVAEYDNHAAPKVIDFGVAKAMSQKLTERTMFTEFGQVLGTMEYMSPEQSKLNQLDIDTRSDIYSLGVLLYELLTGSTPFEGKRLHEAAFDEMLRIIREEEPPKPSTRVSSSDTLPSIAANRHTEPTRLSKDVRGELDWIVMKALEKDRDRRYGTANNLAADIERFLRNESIEAGPASAIYRCRKFVRRHKFGVAAGTAISATVLAGIVGTTYGLIWALREQRAAQASAAHATTQAVRSDQVAQFLKDMLKGVAPSKALGRDTTMLREIVDQTANRIDKDLSDQPEVQIELRLTLGNVYLALQQYKELKANALRTLELARATYGEENAAVADALYQLGRADFFIKAIDEGDTVTRQAIAMERKVRGEGSAEEADALCTMADLLGNEWDERGDDQSKVVEGEKFARRGLSIRRKRFGNDSDETAWGLGTLAVMLWEQHGEGKLAEAEASIREAIAIRQRIHGDDHLYIGWDYKMLGRVLYSEDKLKEAEASYRTALATMERIDGKGKLNQMDTHGLLGKVLYKRGKLENAAAEYREAVAIGTKEVGPDSLDLPMYLVPLTRILFEQDKLVEARQAGEQAAAICKRHPKQIYPPLQENVAAALRDVMKKLDDVATNKSE
jgi:serine/threonine protein kinase/tetratricopeptide (TPR) repeat protein